MDCTGHLNEARIVVIRSPNRVISIGGKRVGKFSRAVVSEGVDRSYIFRRIGSTRNDVVCNAVRQAFANGVLGNPGTRHEVLLNVDVCDLAGHHNYLASLHARRTTRRIVASGSYVSSDTNCSEFNLFTCALFRVNDRQLFILVNRIEVVSKASITARHVENRG